MIIFILDDVYPYNVVIRDNNFKSNNASEYIIYISNYQCNANIEILSNNFENNTLIYSKSDSLNGAVVYLENPGSIIIMDCVFYHNSGFSGTSIYYMEIQNQFIMSLSNNSFEQNFALHGAAGVFLNNK